MATDTTIPRTMVVPQGSFPLTRPPAADPSLRAWDAADEMVLGHVADRTPETDGTWVVLDDAWGALAVGLHRYRPTLVSDSFVAQRSAAANMERNDLDPGRIPLLSSLDPLPARIDVLIVKIPKTSALLADQLRRVRPGLHPETVVVGAGMARHIHTSTLELFESIIGPTRTSRARKRARLIQAQLDPSLDPGPPDEPLSYDVEPGLTLVSHANVFSRGRLDPGTRLLLDTVPSGAWEHLVDLGCGSGVVGVVAARRNPAARVTFTDESYMAVASAEATWRANGESPERARFLVTDCLDGLENGAADLVLANPPFHDRHAVDDTTAWRMINEGRRVLRPGGQMHVVGNRHLRYHGKLKRVFGNARIIASTPRFVVTRARR